MRKRELRAQDLSNATRIPTNLLDGCGLREQTPEARGTEETMKQQKSCDSPASHPDIRLAQNWRARFWQLHPPYRFQAGVESAGQLFPWHAAQVLARRALSFPAHR